MWSTATPLLYSKLLVVRGGYRELDAVKNKRRKLDEHAKMKLASRNDYFCVRCGRYMRVKGDNTVEHVIPLELGGSNKPYNLTSLCQQCNIEKGNNLVLPSAYYFAMSDKECKSKDNLVYCWVSTHMSREDLNERPFIFDEMSASVWVSGVGKQKKLKAAFKYESNADKYVTMYKLEETEKDILKSSLEKSKHKEYSEQFIESTVNRCCKEPTYVLYDDTMQRVSGILSASILEDELNIEVIYTLNASTTTALLIDIVRKFRRIYKKKGIKKIMVQGNGKCFNGMHKYSGRSSAVWFDYESNKVFIDLSQKV